jgi:hypothetical protein
LFEIAGNDDGRSTAGGRDFSGQCIQTLGTACHQSDAMLVRGEDARELGANSGRGSGY